MQVIVYRENTLFRRRDGLIVY